MKRFWKREERELARLERQLRAHRAEPTAGFVRAIRHDIGARRHAFTPRLRYVLLTGVVVAMVAAAASAGLPGVPTPLTNLAGTASNDAKPPPPPPGGDQYKGKCGRAPAQSRCNVEVDPDEPSVKAPKSGTTTVTFTLDLGKFTPTNAFSVSYTTSGTAVGGTACSGNTGPDYISPGSPAIVNFGTNDNSETVTFTICGKTSTTKSKTIIVDWQVSDPTVAMMDHDDDTNTITISYQK
jgi:hypothetical protein